MKYRFICIAVCSLFFSLCAAQNQLGYVADSTAKRLQIKTVSRMYTSDDHTFVDDTVTEVYNKEGLIVSSGSIGRGYDYYYYNNKNQLVKDSVFDPFQGAVNYYFYREDGRLKKSVNMQDGEPGYTVRWVYFTAKGKIVGAQCYSRSDSGSVSNVTDYTYNKYGIAEVQNNNGRTVCEYNGKGLLVKSLFYGSDALTHTTLYTYHKDKRLKQKIETYINNYIANTTINTTTYFYNDKGLLIEEKEVREE